jgi:phosphatidylserine/phosphatidylglycerophosphate/cardiolipin synthase-like enzyme
MKPTAFLLALLGLLLQSCQPISNVGRPAVHESPTSASASRTTSTASSESLSNIPIAVGYGVDGGWYQLYFTDPTNAAADQIDGGPDGPLVEAIDSARLSVDAAMYSLSLNNVRQALIHAHRRGVQVRVVMESDNMDHFDPQALKDAGVPIIGDRHEGLMHNKFVVIDRSEVWSGSMNFTDDGAYLDRNNLMRIRSSKVAADYETEFNEMFVDDKFGPDVGGPTPHPRVTVDGTPLEIYFSPDDHIQAGLVDLLKDTKSSIYFLAYSFTADPLGDAIIQRSGAGVTVSGVMDADQVASNTGTEFDTFRSAGLDIRLDGDPGLMHHKVMILDGQTVVLGSYNFTASAEKYNDENLMVIHSQEIAAQYMQEFQRVYAAAQP